MNFHTRVNAFGSGGGFIRGREPLTDDQLRSVAPSIFATEAHVSRSERFGYVPTIDVINGLRREGFEPFYVKQGGSRDEEKRGFTKHMLRLRNPGMVMRVAGDSVPEVVLLNAHDGTSAYRLMYGFFRLICSNGMIVADHEKGGATSIVVPHVGDIVGRVIEGTYSVLDQAATQAARIEDMRSINLTRGEQVAFASAALTARYGEEPAPITAEQAIEPKRSEDVGTDLWRTFNRAQENLTMGGIGYTQRNERGRVIARRHTRPVNSVDGDMRLNRALWRLAEEMATLKAAA